MHSTVNNDGLEVISLQSQILPVRKISFIQKAVKTLNTFVISISNFYREELIVKCFFQLLHSLYLNCMLLLVLLSKCPFPAVDI